MGQQAVDQEPERVLQLRARGGLGKAQPALDRLAGLARAQRLVTAPSEVQGTQADATEAVGDRLGGKGCELTEGEDPEPFERVDAGRLGHRAAVVASTLSGPV